IVDRGVVKRERASQQGITGRAEPYHEELPGPDGPRQLRGLQAQEVRIACDEIIRDHIDIAVEQGRHPLFILPRYLLRRPNRRPLAFGRLDDRGAPRPPAIPRSPAATDGATCPA